jgi:hypothetical protein
MGGGQMQPAAIAESPDDSNNAFYPNLFDYLCTPMCRSRYIRPSLCHPLEAQ